jgi:predicted O-methyltransferase YrrM
MSKLPSLNTAYGLGEKNYTLIKKCLSETSILKILECGSGSSTVRLGIDYPNASIDSVESEPDFCSKTNKLLEKYTVKNAIVHLCPLKMKKVGNLRAYYTYNLTDIELNANYDFVLIDGPVERRTVRGREGVLYQVFNLINVNGIIVLDDYHRRSSKKVVRNWLKYFHQQLEIVEEYENIVILKKISNQLGNRTISISLILDNWKSLFILFRRNYRNIFKREF